LKSCPDCGSSIGDDAKFCGVCGKKIWGSGSSGAGQQPPQQGWYQSPPDYGGYQAPPPGYGGYQAPTPGYNPYAPRKDSGTAAILGLLGFFGLCGIGQMYVGRVGRGLLILILGILILVAPLAILFADVYSYSGSTYDSGVWNYMLVSGIMLVVYLVFFIWQILDASNLAKEYNAAAAATGRAPW